MISALEKFAEKTKHTFYAYTMVQGLKVKHILCSKLFFPENLAVYEIMSNNTVQPDRPHMTIWRMCFACWVSKTIKHTLRVSNTYCFSTATMVTRTRLHVTLSVQYLYFLLMWPPVPLLVARCRKQESTCQCIDHNLLIP